MTKEETVLRGQAAASLLSNGSFKAALEALESELAERWKSSNPTDVAGRERFYIMVQLMADLGRILVTWKGEADFVAAQNSAAKQTVPTFA